MATTSPIDNEQDHLDHDRVDKMRRALASGGMDEVHRRLGQDAGGPELAEAQRQQRQARDRHRRQRAELAARGHDDAGTGQGKKTQEKQQRDRQQAQERQRQQQRAQASQQATPQKSTETKSMTAGQRVKVQECQRLAAQRERQQEAGLSR
jgi:hypothetical protein